MSSSSPMRVHKAGINLQPIGVKHSSVRRGSQLAADSGNLTVSQQNIRDIGLAVDSVMDEAVVDKGSCHSIVSLGFFPIVLY